jgi:hypothetical protein
VGDDSPRRSNSLRGAATREEQVPHDVNVGMITVFIREEVLTSQGAARRAAQGGATQLQVRITTRSIL